jgi:hypothetical protein
VGIGGLHSVAVVRADTEGLNDTVEIVLVGHSLIAPGVLCGECACDLLAVPMARNEYGLVVVASKGSGFVFLN